MKVRSSIKKLCEFCRIVRRVSRPPPHFWRPSLILTEFCFFSAALSKMQAKRDGLCILRQDRETQAAAGLALGRGAAFWGRGAFLAGRTAKGGCPSPGRTRRCSRVRAPTFSFFLLSHLSSISLFPFLFLHLFPNAGGKGAHRLCTRR